MWHASQGLALEVVESEGGIGIGMGEGERDRGVLGEMCGKWEGWVGDGSDGQDGSGI